MKYQIEVTETLQRIIEVEADDVCGAVGIVCSEYAEGAIVLGADDLKSFEIKEYKE